MSQCRNCQRFGHVANNCSMNYRCVKCLNNHKPGECQNTKNIENSENITPPACIACNQIGHPANYKGCPKRKELETRYREKIHQSKILEANKISHQNMIRQNALNNIVRPNVSYANITSEISKNILNTTSFPYLKDRLNINNSTVIPHKIPTRTQNDSQNLNINYLEDETKNLFGMPLLTLLDKIRNFIPNHKKLTNPVERQQSLLTFALNITMNGHITQDV